MLALLGKTVDDLLSEWSRVNVELMEDHVRLRPDFTFLSNDLDKLSSWEWTVNWPLCQADDESFVLEGFWAV